MQLPISQYAELLQKKYEKLTALLHPFNAPAIQLFDSPKSHYRMRAEFRIWHEKDDFYHVMFDQTTKQRCRIDSFPIANELINRMMKTLLPLLKQRKVLYHRLFQIDYLSTLSNKIIVSLLYHKSLSEEWKSAAENLRNLLIDQGYDVQIIGRASKQKICLKQDYVDEMLPIAGRNYVYRQVETRLLNLMRLLTLKCWNGRLAVQKIAKAICLSFIVVTVIFQLRWRKISAKC